MMDGMSFNRIFKGVHLSTAYVAVTMVLASWMANAQDTSPAFKPDQGETPIVKICDIPGTALEIAMVKVPATNGKKAFWISQHEISWDHYDVFVYELDKPENEDVDAVTRPTRPYISADRGWGHANYPALSVSHRGAKAFSLWLTASTGTDWRLPTVDEWRTACELGDIDAEKAQEHAWLKPNSKRRTHKLASRKPDRLGIHDLHGNVAEWCRRGKGEDDFVLAGTCYLDDRIDCEMIREPVPAWNDTDPQIPKSIWWLADAPFAGFRVVCEVLPGEKSGQQEEVDPSGEKQ